MMGNEYSVEDQQIIGCPSLEQVNSPRRRNNFRDTWELVLSNIPVNIFVALDL